MVYILNIETATKNCSVSLSKNGETVVLQELCEEQFNHAEKLHQFIKNVLDKEEVALKSLNAIAVSKGPGSYTGLRIGVSAAKGLCYVLNIPLIAVDTLAVLAAKVSISSGVILPMIDARRMEVFTQKFSNSLEVLSEVEALIVDENSFGNENEIMHLVGDGAGKCKSTLHGANFIYHDDILYPSANEISKLAYVKYLDNIFEDVAYFEPFYLKDFMLTTIKTKDS